MLRSDPRRRSQMEVFVSGADVWKAETVMLSGSHQARSEEADERSEPKANPFSHSCMIEKAVVIVDSSSKSSSSKSWGKEC